MQNAERRTQNDLITLMLHSQGKNDKCGARSAECGTTLFECGVRNAERLCSAELRKQGKN